MRHTHLIREFPEVPDWCTRCRCEGDEELSAVPCGDDAKLQEFKLQQKQKRAKFFDDNEVSLFANDWFSHVTKGTIEPRLAPQLKATLKRRFERAAGMRWEDVADIVDTVARSS